jgi:hypothetical protein
MICTAYGETPDRACSKAETRADRERFCNRTQIRANGTNRSAYG